MTETETKWWGRIRDWRASGKTAEEYAAGREFKGSTLRYWASVLRRVPSGDTVAAGPQARVRMARVVSRPMSPEATIEVAIGPARVVVRAGFDRDLLCRVVQVLGGDR
jgi:hypothetical protein